MLSEVHQLAWTNDMLQYPSFCVACEAPYVCERAFKFLVIDRVGQVEEHLKKQEIEWTRLTTSSDESILYYANRLRYQQRIDYSQTRRNVLNIVSNSSICKCIHIPPFHIPLHQPQYPNPPSDSPYSKWGSRSVGPSWYCHRVNSLYKLFSNKLGHVQYKLFSNKLGQNHS